MRVYHHQSAPGARNLMRHTSIFSIFFAGFTCLFFANPPAAWGQAASPGPYEILPFERGFIVEAFPDMLQGSSQIADWTGWLSSEWVSPHPYNNHKGTDFSVAAGTPVYAIADGEVVSTLDIYTGVNYSASYGNYVQIKPDGVSPRGEQLTLITAHMQKGLLVSVGQRVEVGDLLGYSHTTGNSTTEHVHLESAVVGGTTGCPWYNAHAKYPIMATPNGKTQLGHIVRVKVPTANIGEEVISGQLVTVVGQAKQGQLYFAAFAKRGHYRIFLPDSDGATASWIAATDVDEVLTGTVIQALPDPGTFTSPDALATIYPMFASPDENSSVVGFVRYGGARFVADQTAPGDWYRIADPALSLIDQTPGDYGWVKADGNMVVYPELYNPAIDLPGVLAAGGFPYINNFTETGRLDDFGRMKFHWNEVKNFSPASPGGDGKAFHLTDHGNIGNGAYESLVVGKPGDRDYYVQADVYFNFSPAYGTWERYGIFLRDDGFGGFDQTFEGAGNCYAMTWDSDDGFLRACKIVNGAVENQPVPNIKMPSSGWHTMRIEAQGSTIRFFLDGNQIRQIIDTDYKSGPCGMGYHSTISSYPAARGGYFDNFIADKLPGTAVADWAMY